MAVFRNMRREIFVGVLIGEGEPEHGARLNGRNIWLHDRAPRSVRCEERSRFSGSSIADERKPTPFELCGAPECEDIMLVCLLMRNRFRAPIGISLARSNVQIIPTNETQSLLSRRRGFSARPFNERRYAQICDRT